ncbi:Ldh family oxidoreductase [Treponema primitia]|uniref:Ldh family oxidoreductase n=1 Tax=Treponema primitia TaxID=88058 RepID=UPI0002554C37|nr:Ldh family oxidoreductase [Treponema primitia]
MAQNTVYESFDKMEAFMKDVFVKVGVPAADAAVCAEVLIESDKRGIDSHGVGRFKPIYIDRIKEGIQFPLTNFEVVKDGLATAVVDGHDGMGQVVGKKAMQMAIDKAKKYGMGMVVARNSTHYGIAGYYATMATKAGMIGITGTNARPSIAPTFGVENMLGTNPLTVGIPSDEDFPFVLDCATSVSQRGKIEHYDRIGKKMPQGWVIDNQGNSETDPAKALDGLTKGTYALAPLGGLGDDTAGYKGYGYATVVEILSAALQQGAFLKALSGIDSNGKKVPYHLGHFFIAIDINAFTELDAFKKTVGDILRDLRASRKMPGHDRIYTAGEKEYLAWLDRKEKGVPLNESLKKTVKQLKEEYKLDAYAFNF